MPTSQFIDPQSIRKSDVLKIRDIPLNAYQAKLKNVKGDFPKSDLSAMFSDMRMIREFENMVQAVRTVKEYNGVEYSYTGPAHLSQGQEAAAVGQAYALDISDYTFGTHRSHGEVLARGLSAIRRLDEESLYSIMKNFKDGALLAKIESFSKKETDVRGLAVNFLLYGFMTELFGREIGFTGGLGNSMHVFFTPFGVYPNNAIVGGSGGIGAGAGLYKKLAGEKGIVVVNSGDGSLSTGHVWEAINFATMDQFTKLWDEKYRGGLPVIFNFMNNYYAMSGQTAGETMGYDILARVGAGFNAEGLFSERVDGYNVFAVIDAFRRKKSLLLDKKGPVLLDTIVYRHAGHSATDPNLYRTKDEMDQWMSVDCIAGFRQELIDEKILQVKDTEEIEKEIKEKITEILIKATDVKMSPRMDFKRDPDSIAKYMFSNKTVRKMSGRVPEVIGAKEDNVRMKKISAKNRRGIDEHGKPVSALRVFSYRDAIFEALIDKFYEDPTMILFGEDVREHGNSFGVLSGLYESVPRHRLFNAPIAESSIISAAVGYALCGGRAVPEIMWCDFLGRCADELFNQLAKWQGMSAGILQMPCVVRVSVGAFYGAQHSQDWSSLAAHIPGLKIVYPASAYDAKGLLNSALSSTDPIMYFESQKLYDMGEMFVEEGVPADYYEVPIGKCDIKRSGRDLTILTMGPTLYPALDAAKELAASWGIEAEVIDARTLVPFDYETLIESVKKTGRVLIVGDACERGGYGKTLAANIGEFAFDYLDAPPVSLGSHNWVSPCPELEKYFFPTKDMILAAIHERIKPLNGFTPLLDLSLKEKLRHEKFGIQAEDRKNMATLIRMPQKGLTEESAFLSKWYVEKGDVVKEGQLLFALETGKATFDVEAEISGTVLERIGDEGDEILIKAVVLVIGAPGESYSLDNSSAAVPASQTPTVSPASAPAQPVRPAAPDPVQGGRIRISPRARHLAEKHHLALNGLAGTGPGGRIIEEDVQAALKKAASAAPVEEPRPAASNLGTALPSGEPGAFVSVPHDRMRKTIAANMMKSLQGMAQLTMFASFDAGEILSYRKRYNETRMADEKLSINDIILFAVSRVILDYPVMNAHYLDAETREFSSVNLGVAVDTEKGLMVPTLKHAETKSLSKLSSEVKGLAARCRSGSIAPEELSEGTFTVSNVGVYGVEFFTPIINPPQTGILGVGTLEYKRKKTENGITDYQAMGLSLTIDHRAVDGAPAARFLQALTAELENFSLLLVKQGLL